MQLKEVVGWGYAPFHRWATFVDFGQQREGAPACPFQQQDAYVSSSGQPPISPVNPSQLHMASLW